MNQKVDCSVYDCMYNATGMCAADEINVCGDDASEVEATCCATFHKGSATNALENTSPSDGTFIGCEVDNCIYNEDRKCELESIQIDTCSCSGETCSCESETCCDSFQCK